MKAYGFKIEMYGDTSVLPEWIGSAVRGAIGTELIKLRCIYDKMSCDDCLSVFECSAKKMLLTSDTRDSQLSVNPYVVRNCIAFENRISFEIILFGDGMSCAGDIFRVLMSGLTLFHEKFRLCSVTDIFTSNQIYNGFIWNDFEPFEIEKQSFGSGELTVTFTTPWINKSQKKRTDFDYFIRACIRRATSAMKACDIELCIDFNKLFSHAKSVETLSQSLELKPISRYSSRTDTKMNLNGFVGSIVFSGDFEEFSDFLSICEYIGIGKLCVMGLGQFTIAYL